MKRFIFIAMACAAVSLYGGISAYIFTSANTPAVAGVNGEVVGIEACSTNATGTAQICAVTDLSVGGELVSFTNCLSEATLVDGVYAVSTNGVFIASKQRIIVSGSAFPGGSITVWIRN